LQRHWGTKGNLFSGGRLGDDLEILASLYDAVEILKT